MQVKSSWFHFICKNIHIGYEGDGQRLTIMSANAARSQIQSDHSWLDSAYVLQERPSSIGGSSAITLFCFGAPVELERRFDELLDDGGWSDVLEDPYILHVHVIAILWRMMDRVAWRLADVFRAAEEARVPPCRRCALDLTDSSIH